MYCTELCCYELDCEHKSRWVSESVVVGWRQQIQVDEVLVDEKDDLAHRTLFSNRSLGRVLMIDDRVQLTSRDERCYHEMFVHVPFMMHGNVENVLVIGGGDGMTLREILKHSNVRCTLVEIDPGIIEFSRKYLNGKWDDPRVTVVIDDGANFVKSHKKGAYDVVIVDSTDPTPDGCSAVLYQQAFYHSCHSLLKEGGVIVTQNGHPNFEAYSQTALSHLAACFKHTTMYQFCVPTYLGGLQAFGWASDNGDLLDVTLAELSQRWSATGIGDVEVYCPRFGLSCFALPLWMERMVQEATKN